MALNHGDSEASELEYFEISPAAEIGGGERLFVELAGRMLVIFNIAGSYFAIADVLGLARLRAQVVALASDGYWHALAKAASSDDLASLQRQLTADALQAVDWSRGSASRQLPLGRVAGWEEFRRSPADQGCRAYR